MMGWQKTMRSIGYLLLLAFLINCKQSIHATPSSPSLSDGASQSTTISSSSSAATSNRERSAKVSSERIKGNFYVNLHNVKLTNWMMNGAKLNC